jgi:PAS domain S-box-containing protein
MDHIGIDPSPRPRFEEVPIDPRVRLAAERFAADCVNSDPFFVGVADAILAMAISDPTLPDNPIIYVNAAFESLTGYTSAEIVGRNCRFLQGPNTNPDDITRLRTAIAERQRITLDLLNYHRDGSPFWNRLMVTPVFTDTAANGTKGDLRYFFASQFDVTIERDRVIVLEAEQRGLLSENARVRREMLDTQARLDLALQAGQLGTWNYDPISGQLDASAGCKLVFGLAADDPFSIEDFFALLHADDRQHIADALAETLATGAQYDAEYRIITRAGDRRWIGARGVLLTRRDGSPLSITGFVTDISARKDAEEHRALMADELTHRVKNTLATVGAVVNQSLRTATSLLEARDAIDGRIASLANAHDILIRDETDGAPISDIVKRALHTFDDGTGTLFTIDGPDLRLEPSVTLALSMALHELATNAVKYGALSVSGGTISVHWTLDPADNGRHAFSFMWQERGGPEVAPPTRSGFGSRMIDRLMAKHMRGQATTSYPPAGVEFRIQATI